VKSAVDELIDPDKLIRFENESIVMYVKLCRSHITNLPAAPRGPLDQQLCVNSGSVTPPDRQSRSRFTRT